MNCLICGSKTNFLSKKTEGGRICKKCIKRLPSFLLKDHSNLQEYTLKNAMRYADDKMKRFNATASYGNLHIDSIHGLFAVAKKLNKENKPKTGNNVFSIYDLSEVGLFCESPRQDHNNVLVDVEFRCSLEKPNFSFSVPVKRSVRCQTKRVDSQHITWEEPGQLEMFRTLFNQMLSNAFERVNQMLCGTTIHQFEIEKARAIFMLPETYTAEDLKKARRLMMKVYHPDVAKEDVTREAQIINEAYDLLKAELEQNRVSD